MSAGGLGSIAAAAAAQQSAAVAAPDSKGDTADDDEMPGLEPAEEAAADESAGDLDPKEIETVMHQVCRVLSLSQPLWAYYRFSDGMHQVESCFCA